MSNTEKMTIQEAAVEAAWLAFREHRATRNPGDATAAMREALEAAAPHMLAGAGDVGGISRHRHNATTQRQRNEGPIHQPLQEPVMSPAIPGAAVEAALSAIQGLPTVENRSRQRTVRAILEAAGPHLMAKAWDEGYDEAEHEPIYGHSPTNPYRSRDDK